ncbi:MAG: 16S rRNA (cytosine(1402)-N(4))-methyltransferase RsmH [Acidobacteriia bacterium]|nr:16S rRNA (cytosine(1402)-N(4))-methyltransferase RsmH [Terriglobia bacterium]
MVDDAPHHPVLVEEVLNYVHWREGGIYIDATLGAGGHAGALLRSDPRARVLGFDVDAAALDLARQRLKVYGDRFQAIHSNFTEMATYLKEQEMRCVDGILADLGMSSMQLDHAERGFSFLVEGPLDMRMDTRQALRAEDVVNHFSETVLADLIYHYGEERCSRRIARAIVSHRPLSSTTQLAEVVARSFRSSRRQRIHPATRTFQALRIAVNEELNSLSRFLDEIPVLLSPGGRAVIISFHSLEDRPVKQAFREWQKRGWVRILTPHVVTSSETEKRTNPRSRSARLRAAERSSQALDTAVEK